MQRSRLEEKFQSTIRPELQKQLNLKNIMQVPKIEKVVLNVGVKEAVADSRVLNKVEEMLGRIAGQKAVRTKARKSIAGFKIREGMPLGVMVTLRRRNMYEFLDKFINLALPKVRDFQGVPRKLDRRGNYNVGLKEWSVFPEADTAVHEKVYGINITIQTSTDNDEHARALLEAMGMPFVKSTK